MTAEDELPLLLDEGKSDWLARESCATRGVIFSVLPDYSWVCEDIVECAVSELSFAPEGSGTQPVQVAAGQACWSTPGSRGDHRPED